MRPQRQKSYHQRKHFNKKKRHDGPPPFDVMLRQFKKKCERAGIIAEVRKREYYEKPSAKRHRAKQSAKAREQRRQRKDEIFTRGNRKF